MNVHEYFLEISNRKCRLYVALQLILKNLIATTKCKTGNGKIPIYFLMLGNGFKKKTH